MRSSLTDGTRWPWWLVTALIALLAGAWWQLWSDDPIAPATVSASTPASASSSMIADRVPEPDAGGSVAGIGTAPSAPASRLKLEGTVLAGAGSFAMVRQAGGSQSLLLRVGDRVDGLVVTDIQSGSVVLTGTRGPVVIEVGIPAMAAAGAGETEPARPAAATSAPPVISVEHLPEAYRGPAPENEVEGH